MADSSNLRNPSKPQKHQQNASPSPSPLPSFIYKAAFVCVLIALLPIFRSGSPDSSSSNKTVLARGLELLHLLLVGVAISYGLFSRRNNSDHPELDKPDTHLPKPDTPQSYVSRVLQVPSVFDDEGAVDTQMWSYSQYTPEETLVMVAKGSRAGGRDATREPPLLPVRSLRSAEGDRVGGKEGTVLPSPIPWRSRSGRMEVKEEPTPASTSSEMRGKATEDSARNKSFRKPSAPPPPPPPPPPLPLGHHHQYHLGVEKKDGRESLKEEVDHSSNGLGPYGGTSVRTVRPPPALPRNESTKINELRAKAIVESDSSDSEDDGGESSDAEELPNSASVERAGTEENEVDRKADEFIAKFREQIRLQRIASLKRLAEQRAQSNP